MKISIAFTLFIVVIGGIIGWQGHGRFLTVTKVHDDLVEEAGSLGITIDAADPKAMPHITKHEREDRRVSAKDTATDLIAFAREMEANEKSGDKRPNEEMQKRILALADKIASLDASQIKTLIGELRSATDLNDDMRKGIIGFAIMTLSTDHPQAALALFTESGDLLKGSGVGKQVVSSALTQWAKNDPMGALDWVQKNAKTHPELVTDQALRGLIQGTASQDPKMAFGLIDELKVSDVSSAVRDIMRTAKTNEERTTVLSALRDQLGKTTDPKKTIAMESIGFSGLASSLASDGFDSAQTWLAGANLTPNELVGFAQGLRNNDNTADNGHWIDWLGKSGLPEKQLNRNVENLMSNWTTTDYQAAGTWLGTMPDGPTKTTSVKSYAETVSPYEPEVAAQWAMTLPAGKERDATLENIHNNWPKNDPAGAEAFAKAHGIH